jgi:hypothetical protein
MALTAPPQTRTPEKTAEAHRFDAEALGRLGAWLGANVPGCRFSGSRSAIARQLKGGQSNPT